MSRDASAKTNPRVLVTGAAGFIGFHVADRLLKSGAAVAGLDNLNAYYDVQLKRDRLAQLEGRAGFGFHELDLSDHEGVEGLFSSFKPTSVIHLAAQAGVRYSIENPRAYTTSNVDGFLSILEACRHHRVDHLIYASSSSVYGTNKKVPFKEDDPVCEPVSLYAATKRANELMARTYSHLYGIRASGLRFFTVYGPWGRPDMAPYIFTKAISEGRPIKVFNHGRMKRDFTYIDDITTAILGLIDVPPALRDAEGEACVPHTIYNIGNHTPIELERFIAAIEAAVGQRAEKVMLPMQPGDVPITYADVEKLTAATGFEPDTTIEDGIAKFVDWYRDYHGR